MDYIREFEINEDMPREQWEEKIYNLQRKYTNRRNNPDINKQKEAELCIIALEKIEQLIKDLPEDSLWILPGVRVALDFINNGVFEEKRESIIRSFDHYYPTIKAVYNDKNITPETAKLWSLTVGAGVCYKQEEAKKESEPIVKVKKKIDIGSMDFSISGFWGLVMRFVSKVFEPIKKGLHLTNDEPTPQERLKMIPFLLIGGALIDAFNILANHFVKVCFPTIALGGVVWWFVVSVIHLILTVIYGKMLSIFRCSMFAFLTILYNILSGIFVIKVLNQHGIIYGIYLMGFVYVLFTAISYQNIDNEYRDLYKDELY